MSEKDARPGDGAQQVLAKSKLGLDGKKVLVLGSTGHAGVACAAWIVVKLPNIVDYDVCIVNVASLTDEILQKTKHEHFEQIRSQLTRVVISNGTLVVVMSPLRWVDTPKQYPDTTNNYRWLPFNLTMRTESGTTIEILEDMFPAYLKKFTRWDFHHLCNDAGSSLKDSVGSGCKYELDERVIVRNREGRRLASEIRLQIYYPRNESSGYQTYKTFSKSPDMKCGPLILLPPLPDIDEREAISLVLQDVGIAQREVEPAWTIAIDIPGTVELEKRIAELEASLEDIKAQIADADSELAMLRRYVQLIYASGSQLEEVFKDSLGKLGGNVKEAKYSNEEYILEWKGKEFLIEVKGNSKSVSLDNVRQLLDYTIHYLKDTGRDGKGILFGNAWRVLPLKDRDVPGKPTFPDDVRQAAVKHGIALVSSTAYFDAFRRFMRGELSGEFILDRMVSTSGVVTF